MSACTKVRVQGTQGRVTPIDSIVTTATAVGLSAVNGQAV